MLLVEISKRLTHEQTNKIHHYHLDLQTYLRFDEGEEHFAQKRAPLSYWPSPLDPSGLPPFRFHSEGVSLMCGTHYVGQVALKSQDRISPDTKLEKMKFP